METVVAESCHHLATAFLNYRSFHRSPFSGQRRLYWSVLILLFGMLDLDTHEPVRILQDGIRMWQPQPGHFVPVFHRQPFASGSGQIRCVISIEPGALVHDTGVPTISAMPLRCSAAEVPAPVIQPIKSEAADRGSASRLIFSASSESCWD